MQRDKKRGFAPPNGLLYGGDYNPEQWPREVWDLDIELMQKAGVNCVSLGIFSWALLQPAEDRWDFEWLDDIVERLHRGGISIDLATATASQPPWLSVAYPDVLPVDEYGRRVNYGSRQSYCPNNPDLRRLSGALARRMAERYGKHPALILWHVNNEYACHTDACYCNTCRDEFQSWLKNRYGSIGALNDSWGTRFWSQSYGDFSQIPAPKVSSAQRNPAHVLDYRRFMSHSLLECYLNERAVLKEITPEIPVTTNFMMRFKPVDYFAWSPHVDVISWDSYPDPDSHYDPAHNALDHDIMRGLGNGAPFILMEQASSQVNWRKINQVKPPGMMERFSYQALAHGADAIMFFQWRQSLRGAEKWHSAMVDHSGRDDSRTFTEISRLGRRLIDLAGLSGSRSHNRAAIVFDYQSWWSAEYEPGPSTELRYLDAIDRIYRGFRELHIPVDIISVDGDFSAYPAIAAPLLHMVSPEAAQRIREYCQAGGHFLAGPWSGMVDPGDGVYPGGYPGGFADFCGMHFTEFCPLPEGKMLGITAEGRTFSASRWFEPLTADGARVLAEISEGPFAGRGALTVNPVGSGEFWYSGCLGEADWNRYLVSIFCTAAGVESIVSDVAGTESGQKKGDVEVLLRRGPDTEYLFLINFGDAQVISLKKSAFSEVAAFGSIGDCLHDDHPVSDEGKVLLSAGQTRILEYPLGYRTS